MVAVAIIGILASIAIPNYQRYQARARQSEAKIGVSSIYTAEQGFKAEQGTYTVCLRQIGVAGDSVERRYYALGPSLWGTNLVCGPNGTTQCWTYNYSGITGTTQCSNTIPYPDVVFPQTARSFPTFTMQTWTNFGSAGATPCFLSPGTSQDTFLGCASGSVSKDNITDAWLIDVNKTMINIWPGI